MGNAVIGICIELCATFAGTAGKQLVRYSTLVEEQQTIEEAEQEQEQQRNSTTNMDETLMPDGVHATGAARPELMTEEEKEAKSSAVFKLGLVFQTALSPILEMSAYAFAAQSLLAPFGG